MIEAGLGFWQSAMAKPGQRPIAPQRSGVSPPGTLRERIPYSPFSSNGIRGKALPFGQPSYKEEMDLAMFAVQRYLELMV
jgi:hypothetical protein